MTTSDGAGCRTPALCSGDPVGGSGNRAKRLASTSRSIGASESNEFPGRVMDRLPDAGWYFAGVDDRCHPPPRVAQSNNGEASPGDLGYLEETCTLTG